jgi:hypothetical protein
MIDTDKKEYAKIKCYPKNSLIQFVTYPFYKKYKSLLRN